MIIKPVKFSLILIAVLVLPTLFLFLYNIYIDPFQIFHKDLETPTTILPRRGKDRFQHAGVINQYPIQSIILGHSHLANYLPSKVEKEFNIKNVFNLTMDGSPIYEHALVAKYALKKHALELIIWGFNSHNLLQPYNVKNKKIDFPQYLYDQNRYNDLKFFLSLDLNKYHKEKMRRRLRILNSADIKMAEINEIDRATAWFWNKKGSFNRPLFIANKIIGNSLEGYNRALGSKNPMQPISKKILLEQIPLDNSRFKNYFDNLNINIKPLVSQNPDVSFYFIFSPSYPLLYLQVMKLNREIKYLNTLRLMVQFVQDMSAHKNVKIFGFNLEKFTEDLRMYKDKTHGHLEVNNYLLEKMASGDGLLTKKNIVRYILDVDGRVLNYRLPDRWMPGNDSDNISSERGYLTKLAARKIIENSMKVTDQEIIKYNKIGGHQEFPNWAKNISQ